MSAQALTRLSRRAGCVGPPSSGATTSRRSPNPLAATPTTRPLATSCPSSAQSTRALSLTARESQRAQCAMDVGSGAPGVQRTGPRTHVAGPLGWPTWPCRTTTILWAKIPCPPPYTTPDVPELHPCACTWARLLVRARLQSPERGGTHHTLLRCRRAHLVLSILFVRV